MKILITSGGTKVPIDRVRSITNMSRGTFGSRIADAFLARGLMVHKSKDKDKDKGIEKITFFFAKDSRLPSLPLEHDEPFRVADYRPIEYVSYSTFDEYKEGVENLLKKETYDIIVIAAAVSDYGVANYYNGKYRSREDDMCIKLVKLPKILPIMRELAPTSVICGFKLLVDSTDAELVAAMKKQIEEVVNEKPREVIEETGVDLVVGNDLRDIKADDHRLLVMKKDGEWDGAYTEYRQPPREKRHYCSVYPLAKHVVEECMSVYERRCT